jgi:hypothetical protein
LVGNNTDTIIDTNINKCNICSQLEMQAKSDAELNRVYQAKALFISLIGDAIEAVWIELKE